MKKYKLSFLMLCLFCTQVLAKPTYNIGILADNKTSKTDVLLKKLQKQIVAVVGEDALIKFPQESILSNNYTLDIAKQNYQKLLANNTDIILAFGVINNEVISQLKIHKKPTILFGAINKDYNDLDINKKFSGIKNYTYLIESESYKEDLEKFQQLVKYKNIGILIDASVVEFLPLDKIFKNALKDINAGYKIIPFQNINDVREKLDGVDAIYLAGGFFLEEQEVKQLAQIFIDKKLPSFTLNGIQQVKNGIMASHQAAGDIDQFFRRISLTIEAYISGIPLAEMPVYIDYTSQLTVNYNVAHLLGVPIKYSLIADTDFVGNPDHMSDKKKYNLKSIVNQVLQNNLNLSSSRLDVQLSEQGLKSAKSNYLPSISAAASGTYIDPELAALSGGTNPEFSTSANLSVSQTIFSDTANAGIEIQRNLQMAEVENYNTQQLNTIFEAVNAYFNILILKTNTQIQLQNLKLTKGNLKLAQQSYEVGQSGKSDTLRFISAKAQNTQSMVEVVNQLEQSYIKLNQLLNNPIDDEIDIENVEFGKGVFKQFNYTLLTELLDSPTSREPFIRFIIEQAQLNSPELKALDYNILATQRDIKLNGSSRFLPTISLNGQYNKTFNRSGAGSISPPGGSFLDDNYNIALTFSVPLFNKNQFSINRQKAIIQEQQLYTSKKNTEVSIEVNIRVGVLNLINEVSNINLSDVSVSTAHESLELTKLSYASGAVNIVQLIDAQNNYINAQLLKANAVYNFLINALQLERFLGYYFFLNTEAENNKFKAQVNSYINNQKINSQ